MFDPQFKLRRSLAICAFIGILLIITIVLCGAVFGAATVGSNLAAATGIISPAMVCLTGVIGQYAHTVYKTDTKEKSNAKPV